MSDDDVVGHFVLFPADKNSLVTDFIRRIEDLEEEWQCANMDPKIEKPVAAHIEAIYYQAEKAGFDKEAIKIVVEARNNGALHEDPAWTNRATILSYLDQAECEDGTMAEYPLV